MAASAKSSQNLRESNRPTSRSIFVIYRDLAENDKYRRNPRGVQIMTESSKLRTAAIGVGSLGRHHARNYAEISAEGRVEYVGACDIDAATAEGIASVHGGLAFTNWRELLDKTDVVSIATPTETHCEIACAFLDGGVHVLVEKPIAISLDEANRMIAASDRSGAKLMVGQLERFNPA